MIFASLIFLYAFLPLNLILYYGSSTIKARNLVLIVFSLFFYAWGEPVWVCLLLFSAFADYIHGRVIESTHKQSVKWAMVISSLVVNLGLLVIFKYSGFFVSNINGLLGTGFAVPNFALPIGISFYSFQTISYTIDVYRGEVKAQHSFLDFLMYVSLYPQLVAGPIVRYSVIADEISNRRSNIYDISEGISRFLIGLGKKVVIANVAGALATKYMDAELGTLSMAGAWFGVIMFSLQIYFDFAGYSDMAIGLGWMFGFHYDENFIFPYISKSITEFWRRWHISLGSFFRDYVYIPLGGNRKHQTFNIFVVWFLTGLWHGASWNFILWGLYFGVLLIIEKKYLLKKLESLPSIVGHVYLLFLAVIGWAIFYFTDLGQLFGYLGTMFGIGVTGLCDPGLEITVMNNIFWIVFALVACTPFVKKAKEWIIGKFGTTLVYSLQIPLNICILFLCTAMLAGQSYNPFLYFRF